MYNFVNVTQKIYRIGVNDRTTALFESMWPLPNGVAYNSYLIKDEKTALLDTVRIGFEFDFVQKIEQELNGRTLDYLIINHMELDHAGEIKSIVNRYPNIKIVGNKKTFGILEAYFGLKENLIEIADGETLKLGHHELKFVFTPFVHWPESMMSYDMTENILFSADAFGTFGTLDGGIFDDEINIDYYIDDARRYYSNIVGKFSGMVQKAFAKLAGVKISVICPLHGPIWRKDPMKIISLYDKWSKYEADDAVVIIYASMYGNTAAVADFAARKVAEQGIKDIRVYDVSKTHISMLISEIWRCKGVILGSCAYNSGMHPMMENLTRELTHMGVKNRYLGIFGSYSWNGGGVRTLNEFAKQIAWEQVADSADLHGTPTDSKLAAIETISVAMAKKIKGE